MAFSNLPDICDYSESPADQQAFFDQLQIVINELCGTTPITLRQSTVPTQDDFETAWLAADVANDLPIPTSAEFMWYDTSRLQVAGIFRTLEDEISNVTRMVGGTDDDPAWNWVTRKIAFDRLYSGANRTIVVTDMTNNEETPLTPGTGSRREPAWNDAGTMIVFTTTEFGGQEIAKMNADGSGVVQLTSNAFNEGYPHWRGTKIVYETDEYGAQFEIKIMNDDGTGATRLTTTGGGASSRLPQLSPDGTKIAYMSGTGVNRTIYIMDSNGANQTPLSTVPAINSDFEAPTWSPDGEWIYFAQYRIRPDATDEEVWFETPTVDTTVPSDVVAGSWINYLLASQPLNVSVDSTGQVVAYVNNANNRIRIQSISADDRISTGKIYQVSQYVDPAGNVRLLQQDNLDGTTAGVSLSGDALPDDIDHVLIIIEGVGTTAAAINQAFLKFNGDSAVANYHTLYYRGNSATLTRNEITPGTTGTGIILPFGGNVTAGQSSSVYMIWIPAIRDTDCVKQAIFEGAVQAGTVVTLTNYNVISGVGVRNSLDAINQIELTLAGALGNFLSGSKVSWYGLPGTPRWDKE